MSWVLLDIVVPLLITFSIGLATGWLLWRWRRQKATDTDLQTSVVQSSTPQGAELDESANLVLIEERDVAIARAEKAEGELESLKMGLDHDLAGFDSTPDQSEPITRDAGRISNSTELEALAAELEKEKSARAEMELALSDLNSRYVPLKKLVEQDESLHEHADNDRTSEKIIADKDSELSLLRKENERLQTQLASAADKIGSTDNDASVADSQDKSDNIRKLSSYSADGEQPSANSNRQNPADNSTSQAMPATGSVQGNAAAATASVAAATASELDVEQAPSVLLPETHSEELVDQPVDKATAEPATKESNDTPGPEVVNTPASPQDNTAKSESAGGESDAPASAGEVSEEPDTAQNVTSINVASNKKQKKLASDKQNSDNQDSEKRNDVEPQAASEYVPKGWEVPEEPPNKSERDDLQAIKGIGPVLEKMLHQTGIYYYRQIAALDESGVAELDDRIPQFSGRIERDNWVGQAKELMSADT